MSYFCVECDVTRSINQSTNQGRITHLENSIADVDLTGSVGCTTHTHTRHLLNNVGPQLATEAAFTADELG